MRRLLLSLLFVVMGCGAHAQGISESVRLRSATYADFRQILTRTAPDTPIDVAGKLDLPATPATRIPAVVVVHTLAGFRDSNEGWQAEQLRAAGFATLTYDSFSTRGLGDLVNIPRRGPPPYPSALADAFAALDALSRDPRIDPQRIAILGFSFGGEVANATAFERIRATLSPDRRFAAHVAYYPAGVYGVVADAGAYTGAPVLMMVGDDDTLPIDKIRSYLACAEAASHPAPIELVVFPGAKHGWTDPGLGAARNYPYLASTRKCPFALISQREGLRFLVDNEVKPFDDRGFETCIRDNLGYTMGYDDGIRRKSTSVAIDFLKRHLGP